MQNNSSSDKLIGKVAIVTGASSGIGKAVAEDLANAGLKVVIGARRKKELETLQKGREDIAIVSGDITDPDMPEKLIAKAKKSFGRCDIFVHAAGVLNSGKVENVDVEDMCRMARINFEASVRVSYVVLKYFKDLGSGHLIHLSSILGTKVRPGIGVYAGTKYGIEALVEAFRMELANTNIKISAIQPGVTITELHNKLPVHPRDALNITAPLQPEDIVRCVRFILEQPEHVRIPTLMILPGEQEI